MSDTASYYDLLNRLTDSVDVGTNGGSAWTRPGTVPTRSDTVLVSSVAYDAAGRAWKTTDPRGIESRTYYDLLGRTTKTIENYVDGVVSDSDDKTTEYTYSAAGLTALKADLTGGGGETTQYVYGVSQSTGSALDSNDIVGVTEWPDPTTGAASTSQEETTTVNALGQTLTSTDRNGSTHTLSYDVLGRVVSDAVTTLGSGVDGTVRRIDTAYDSQGNAYLMTEYSAVTGGSIVNQVEQAYNGLGQLTQEWQSHSGAVNTSTTPSVQYGYSTLDANNRSRLTSMTYPNGRVIGYTYASGLDSSISRLSAITDSGVTLESYSYLGLGTVVIAAHAQTGVDLSYVKLSGESVGDAGDQYTGLDRFGRMVDERWRNGNTDVDRFTYTYDRDGNALSKTNVLNSSLNEVYTYDGLNQVASFNRGSGTRTQSFDYNALGNRDGVTTNGSTQSYTSNDQNEITGISGASTPTYDANGNMTDDETGKQYVYDAWNRLVAFKNSGGTTLKTYGYDGLNRRVSETVSGTTTDLYYSSNWQVLEERVAGANTASYVWSAMYVDALIARDRDTDGNGTLDERLYATHDANFNVTSLINTSGSVVERYVYDTYGAATVMNASGTVLSGSAFAWQYLFQGGKVDAVSGLVYFEHRDYSVTLGSWSTSDPIRFTSYDANFYRFVGNNPVANLDSSGLASDDLLEGIVDEVRKGLKGRVETSIELKTPSIDQTVLGFRLKFAFKGKVTARAISDNSISIQVEGAGEASVPAFTWLGVVKVDVAPWGSATGKITISKTRKHEGDVQIGNSFASGDIRLNFGVDLKPSVGVNPGGGIKVGVEGKLRLGASISLLTGEIKLIAAGEISAVMTVPDPFGLGLDISRKYTVGYGTEITP